MAYFLLAGMMAEGQITENCVVDAGAAGQRIDGFGGASAFVDNWNSAWADLFFSTNNGVGLSLLRTRIPPDGSVPDPGFMQCAQARGARVWSTPWTPPAAYKSSGSATGEYFQSQYYQPYAAQLAGYVANVKTNYGVNLYAISVQNEPDYYNSTYETCVWNGNQIHDFVPYLYQALTDSGVGNTKIMLAEEAVWSFDLAEDTLTNADTAALVGIVAAHDYNLSYAPEPTTGQALWQTEDSELSGSFDGGIADAMFWAGQIHEYMTAVQVNAYHYWWLTPQGNNNQGLTDEFGHASKRLYVFGQYSRFVRPGFYRIGTTNGGLVLASAYQEPGTGHFAIVAANTNLVPITETFTLMNFTTGQLMPWITSGTQSLAPLAAVAVTNGSFTCVMPAQSIMTFTGVTNLNATITTQPQSQTVIPGRTVPFSVSAGGVMPLSYAWQSNGVPIAGATNMNYCVTNAVVGESGEGLRCAVSNSFGVVTSAVATLTVLAPDCVEPPSSILYWWEGEGTNEVDILQGNNGVLMGGATATNCAVGNGVAFNGSTSYVVMPRNLFAYQYAGPMSFECWFQTTNGGVILGEQATSVYAGPNGGWIPHIYVGTDGHLYAQMFYPGAFDQIVTATPVTDGLFHHLVVTFDGFNEILYLDGAAAGITRLQASNYTAFFLCQLGTGYTANWPAGNGGWYSFNGIIAQPALYTNALTAAQVQALYYAGSAGKCTDGLLPVIMNQPTNQMVAEGGTATFGVNATCVLPLTYQWLAGGVALGGATNASLSVTHVSSVIPTNYAVVVTSYYGSVTSVVATLSVTPPVCVEPPAGIEAWWLAGSNAVDVIGGNNGALMNGASSADTLIGNGFSFNGGGGYVQLPQNLIPPANAAPFSIELWFETASGGVILEHEAAQPLNYPSNGWLPDMYVGTDGNLYVQLFWDGAFNQISTGAPVNDGRYHHLAVTYDGSNETVYLDGAAIGSRALAYSTYTTNFYCQFGNGYTQYWPAGNGGWFPFNGIIDQPTLYANALTAAQVLSIFNAGSAGKCTDELLPIIVNQPTNVTFMAGGAAVFNVSAFSLLPMSYQWLAGAAPIAGATNVTLTLTNTTTNNLGNYAVAISTSYGSVTSAVAALSFPKTATPFSVKACLLPDRTVQLAATNWPGVVFRVLGSTDLLSWQTIATLTNVTGTVQFTDPVATNFNQRFYRMVSP